MNTPIVTVIDTVTPTTIRFHRPGGWSVTASRSHLERRLTAAEECDLVGVCGVDLDWSSIKSLLTAIDEKGAQERYDVELEKAIDLTREWAR